MQTRSKRRSHAAAASRSTSPDSHRGISTYQNGVAAAAQLRFSLAQLHDRVFVLLN
jgi:hypothetical protein